MSSPLGLSIRAWKHTLKKQRNNDVIVIKTIIIIFAVAAVRQGTSGRRQRHSQKATRFRDVIRPTSSGRIQRQQPGGANKLLQDDWLNEADYSCIQNRRTVPPPVVINARHTTSWAMYEGRPRLYTTYKCKWGYVARPPHTAGSLYCRHGVWVGRAPFCQRFGETARSRSRFRNGWNMYRS